MPCLDHPISAADNRLDDWRLAELPPQAQDRDRDDIGERIGVLVPDLLEELLGRHHRAVCRHEHLEHPELLPGYRHLPSGPGDGPAAPIDGQVTPGEHRWSGGAAAGEGTDPGDQLGEGERFGQVVVGTEVEPLHAVCYQTGGGEHQDTAGTWRVHDLPAEGVTMQPREVAVENDDVIGVQGRLVQAGRPVIGEIDRYALVA